jgi:mannitol-1-phosphate 5-dehydrogenase
MKKAVMYGAGNIGRGFIGKVFSESGYDVCFVDVYKPVVDRLNIDKQYPVKIVSNEKQEEIIVKNVRAVNGIDIDAVALEILDADIMATAVGVNVLGRIVKPICEGLKKRHEHKKNPLNVIICENLIDADKYLRGLIEAEMGEKYKSWLDENLGLVEASIGRMVPVMTDEMRQGNILKVWVEPYEQLPLDKDAFKGPVPKLNNVIPFSPFGFYIKRKLFVHNMGHAMCAYFGYQKGYKVIDVCIADDQIKDLVKMAMKDSALALSKQYGIDIKKINDNIDDLIYRFGNHILGDTVSRVGKDPIRKLGNNDRLVGAAINCMSQGIRPNNIVKGIVAGLKYDNPGDEYACKIQSEIKDNGIESCIENICGIEKDDELFRLIIKEFQR